MRGIKALIHNERFRTVCRLLTIGVLLSIVLNIVPLLPVAQGGEEGVTPQTVSRLVYGTSDGKPRASVSVSVYSPRKKEVILKLPKPLVFLKARSNRKVMAPEGTLKISGNVTENSTGRPLSGVTVSLMWDGKATQFSTVTDAAGNYSLEGVGPGKYILLFEHPGYSPEEFGVELNDDLTQDCAMFRTTSLKAQVTNEWGEPLEGVTVTLVNQNVPDQRIRLSTALGGWFSLVEVPPGRYLLSVSQGKHRKKKMIWLDEHPQELRVMLSGVGPVSPSVPEAVYGENSSVENTVYGTPQENRELSVGGSSRSRPKADTVKQNQPGAGDVIHGTPSVGDSVYDSPSVGNEIPAALESVNQEAGTGTQDLPGMGDVIHDASTVRESDNDLSNGSEEVNGELPSVQEQVY
ncbi:carboxypeptidase regulatory-like domain-containing protein [Calderihabitans maritimus]|uniref:Carboxypeptidase regulatory-like domain-containing protein n=1 Tax=Calderihabitans maritimus TaxID=1246530 RepID=A0A1Z5HVP4_9FIRM|nr:carboxypeptidase regulatory-like domain-containing protein [Calderihabitans maritimus]GAW93594.1 hypothetical protein TherJR_2218 [Calderihabitans maritimus]